MIFKESNFKRRAQRVKLPVGVEINGKVYETRDISVLGVGVEGVEGEFRVGDKVHAKLILPFREGSVVIPVVMEVKRVNGKDVGFEFVELSPQKRRAIRQYIEFAIEGRLDEIETVMATLNLPTVESPITESLALAEEEQANLYRSFKKHMLFWLVFGGVVLAVFAAFIIYNSIFIFKGYGVVAGTGVNVIAPVPGMVEGVYVSPGDFVRRGTVMFDVKNEELERKIKEVKAQIQKLEEIMGNLSLQNETPVILVLKEILSRQKAEYERAKRLFKRGAISVKDFQFVENGYLRAKLTLAREMEKVLSKKEKIASISERKRELEKELSMLKRRRENLRIKAPHDGWVREVRLTEGSRVFEGSVLAVVERGPLFVLCRVPNWELNKMAADEPVKIYSPLTGKLYLGKISQVGFVAGELGSDETTVRVDFLKQPGLPVGSRVTLWFINRVYARIKHVL